MSTLACTGVNFSPGGAAKDGAAQASSAVAKLAQTETFLFDQVTAQAKVDILIIDDNSASMQNKQPLMAPKLNNFISSMGNVDWQLGITTQDVSDGPLGIKGSLVTLAGTNKNILTPTLANYQDVFAKSIVRSELGSDDERANQAMIYAFAKKDTDNAGFFRAGADLVVVILSDEDEAQDGGPPPKVTSDVIRAFRSTFGTDKNLTVYAILMIPGDVACYNDQHPFGSDYGYIHAALVHATGGVMGSICDPDYGASLASIGSRIKLLVNKTVVLANDADPTTIQVVVTPTDSSLTWTVSGQAINFNKTPAQNTRVDITYIPL